MFHRRNCFPRCLDSSLVRGKIVLCDNNNGIEEVFNSGAIGAITRSGRVPDVSFVVPLPALALVTSDLELVQSYVNSTKLAIRFPILYLQTNILCFIYTTVFL